MMKCFTMNKIDQLVPYALIWKDLKTNCPGWKAEHGFTSVTNQQEKRPRKPSVRCRLTQETPCALQPWSTLLPDSGSWLAQTVPLVFLPLGFPWVQSMGRRLEGVHCCQSLLCAFCKKSQHLLRGPSSASHILVSEYSSYAPLCFP